MPIVTVFGGSGFIGRYVTQKLARNGWRVRVAVRRPNEAQFVRPYGDVGQVEPIQANIRDEESTLAAIRGSDAVINLVAILFPTGKQTFDAIQKEGAERIARLTAQEGIDTLVHISAIGADPDSDIPYAQTKGEAERAVLTHVPTATILRPSLVFGTEDQFFNRFASMARTLPVMPLIGGDTRFQPVYVGDVAEAAVNALTDASAQGQTYELGGPDIVTMREVYEIIYDEIYRERLTLPIPWWMAKVQGFIGELPNRLFGMAPILTRDQVAQLKEDNVVTDGAKGLADIGVTSPTTMEAVLPSYLHVYRPHGQYARMKPREPGRGDDEVVTLPAARTESDANRLTNG
jgi:NADH dehydrogenase